MARKTPDELQELLVEQLGFIESSCAAYDGGNRSEAKRLAVSLRILLHDTTNSASLLNQLGIKLAILFLDSAGPLDPRNLWSTMNLIGLQVTNTESGSTSIQVPLLDDGPQRATSWKPFDDWWNQVVVKDLAHEEFSRKDLVLALANKEGGAHVDPKTADHMRALSKSNTLGWFVSDGRSEYQPDDDPILPNVRQIAHELVRSLQHFGIA